jgi:hypothetical protein
MKSWRQADFCAAIKEMKEAIRDCVECYDFGVASRHTKTVSKFGFAQPFYVGRGGNSKVPVTFEHQNRYR